MQTTSEPYDNTMMQTVTSVLDAYVKMFSSSRSKTPVYIPQTGVIAGPVQFSTPQPDEYNNRQAQDNLHFPLNHSFLRKGLRGIAKTAAANRKTANRKHVAMLDAIARTYDRAANYVSQHAYAAKEMARNASGDDKKRLEFIAQNCRALSEQPPGSFIQAVQLFWCAWRFRCCPHGTATIGRLDQYLYPCADGPLENS